MLPIRSMNADDVPWGMKLKDQAGWNQTPADWQRLLALQPQGCFAAEYDGQVVGTTCVTCFGAVAWISMVLVDASYRGRGIGTRLMEHALAYLEGKKIKTARLDATPLGRPVYARLGFAAQYDIARREGTAEPIPVRRQSPRIVPAAWQQLDAIAGLDCQSPPLCLNVAGPERLSVRAVCEEFARILAKPARFCGEEAPDALLSDGQEAYRRYGPAQVGAPQMIRWVAEWTGQGAPTHGKPTHFQSRDGAF
jgi:GNAT superfamily N-acetyltransferase